LDHASCLNGPYTSRRLKNGKAAVILQIQPELLKYSKAVIPELTKLCNAIWESKYTVRLEKWN